MAGTENYLEVKHNILKEVQNFVKINKRERSAFTDTESLRLRYRRSLHDPKGPQAKICLLVLL